ncbi:MAG: hypothetical protein WBL85_03500, partial [Sedimentisphaerales bacterium]
IEGPISVWQHGLKIARMRKKEKIPHRDSLALVFRNRIKNGGHILALREKERIWAILTMKSKLPALMTQPPGSITANSQG